MLTRRDFLKAALSGLALAAANPSLAWASGPTAEPVLVALHLTGGNDALNTLIPYRHSVYQASRPQLALKAKGLLTLTDEYAFHPELRALARRYEEGQVKLWPGVGRPDHDRSHFRSSDLWHSAGHPLGHGWLARLGGLLSCRAVSLGDTVSRAVACPGSAPIGILGKKLPGFPGGEVLHRAWSAMMADWQGGGEVTKRIQASARLVDDMAGKLAERMEAVALPTPFGNDDFGSRFELACRMVAAGFPSRLYHIGAGQFDTHSEQLDAHARQLSSLDYALEAFLTNMRALGLPVVVMVYSEFGRRVQENLSGGTDHGGGGLAWLAGETVGGGLQGSGYSLDSLDDGDLKVSLDYRDLYRMAVSTTFGAATADSLFGGAAAAVS